jgi:hypothetical protein
MNQTLVASVLRQAHGEIGSSRSVNEYVNTMSNIELIGLISRTIEAERQALASSRPVAPTAKGDGT